MSNQLAIATVTTAVAQIIRTAAQSAVAGADVLTERPDPAPLAQPRVRLFLYHVVPNAALRNNDLPARTADGTLTNRPAVALDLRYLLAFYGTETDLEPQRMLGAVVRDLHARPVLTRTMISDAILSQPFLTGSNLADSIEQVKIVPLTLEYDELSKLWSIFFQTPYALSVAYQASVVIIESDDLVVTPLPVLRRGEDDRGVETQVGSLPTIDSIHIGEIPEDPVRLRFPSYPSARMGSILTIRGRNLGAEALLVRFTHPDLAAPIDITVPPAERSDTRVKAAIPSGPAADAAWATGLYKLALVLTRGGEERTSSVTGLRVAPQITGIAPASPIAGQGTNVTLTVQVSPQIRAGQPVRAYFAGREIEPQPFAVPASAVDFVIPNAPAVTDEILRLRVDGIDTLPFLVTGTPPQLAFDDAQRVTIQ
jgi:hypothetical protein